METHWEDSGLKAVANRQLRLSEPLALSIAFFGKVGCVFIFGLVFRGDI